MSEPIKALPTGKVFYPIEDETTANNLSKILSKDFITSVKLIHDSLQKLHFNSPNTQSTLSWGLCDLYRGVTIVGDHQSPYPKIQIAAPNILSYARSSFTVTQSLLKKNVGSVMRLDVGGVDIPISKNTHLVLQWCPFKKGIIVHNNVYEGELLLVKGVSINKSIANLFNKLKDEINLSKVVGENLEIERGIIWLSGEAKYAKVLTLLNKVADDSIKLNESITLLYLVGYLKVDHTVETSRYVSAVCEVDSAKIKIPAAIRAQLAIQLGAYTLPPNYHEWFDN